MMRTTDERILNPCPICGCSVRVWAKRFDEEDMEYIIECDNDFCGLTYGISCGYNREEIKKAWNSVTALSPTVSEDCISRANLPKKLNGVVLDNCDKIVEKFLEEHECDELWNVVRALRDFYDWTMDAPPVNQKQITGKLENAENATSEGEESTMGQPKSKLESDTISRQAAIEAIENTDAEITAEEWDELTNAIKSLPFAEPEHTKMIKEIRKWINSGNRGSADYFIVDKIEEIINKYEE